MSMQLFSPIFLNKESIPQKYTCDGDDINPPLKILDAPEETVSFVLICDDPDAPMGDWDHWLVFNIPKDTKEIKEASVPKGLKGENSWGRLEYGGPCPPEGQHRYFFKIYALDCYLDLVEGSNKNEIINAMKGHILDQAQLIGIYERS